MTPQPQSRNFWNESIDEIERYLGVSGEGLTSEEAAARLTELGPNSMGDGPGALRFLSTARRVANPLVLILLGASFVSALVGELINAGVIAVMVVVSVGIDVYQTHRSAAAARRLRQRVESRASVKRDGMWVDLEFAALVPGDRLRLRAGDIVPADARLISANYLLLDEAAFSGESMPVEKLAAPNGVRGEQLTEATNAVFMGTVVAGGSGEAVVVRTGRQTAFAGIAAQLQRPTAPTAFDRGLARFGLLIARTVALLVVFVLLVNLLERRSFLDSVLFAVALAVGLTPEFLPMILSVTQAEGALRMARSKVIVRELAAIQNFGNLDVICSDKTGTLTQGRMEVERAVDVWGRESARVRNLAVLNASLQTDIKSPFDEALAALSAGETCTASLLSEVPFDFDRRRLSVGVKIGDECLMITKGAPESVLAVSSHVRRNGATAVIDEAERQRLDALTDELGDQGFRLLAVATAPLITGARLSTATESELTLEGLVAFRDPVKEDVAGVLAGLREDGIALKILTGDAEAVTRRVCQIIGFGQGGRPVSGTDIQSMDEAALGETLKANDVFVRVAPEQKLRIIRALQRQGHVVGYLGDGINDAPSLRAADVGISVEGAVDVAREAAQIVLLEKSLDVLHVGVIEGRKVFGNVMKYIMMGTSSNFGNMLSMAGAVVFLPFLPLLPSQVLLNNALYDFAQLSIPLDRVDESVLRRPRGWDIRFIRDFMLVFGPISSAYDFLTFYVLRSLLHADEKLFHTGWFVESLATQTLVIFVIRTAGSPLKSRPSGFLAATVICVVLTGSLLPFSPLAKPLGFVPVPLDFAAFVALAVITYLAIVELVKRLFFRFHPYA